MGDPHGGQSSAPANAKASPVRLVVLLGILAILAGALGYDQLVAKPGALAANTTLEREVNRLNSIGFDPKLTPEEKAKLREQRIVNPQKVHEILKREPTWTDKHDDHIVEYYCWWGIVPINRHYLSVIYFGKEPNLRYNTHHQNIKPPAESLPGFKNVGDASVPAGFTAEQSALPGETPAPGAGKGKGMGMGKGKGKGPPPPGESGEDPATTPPPPPPAAPGAETKPEATPAKTEPTKDAPQSGEKPAGGDKTEDKPAAATEEKKSAP